MPIYCKTEGGWKRAALMWEKRASGWVMVNPLYVKKSETQWEALPFGTMLAPAIAAPASGAGFKAGSAITVAVSAISSSGFADSGAGTQIQIATDTGFANIVSSYDGAYVTSWTSGALSTTGYYYVRARHKGALLGWGPWSATYYFSIIAAIGQVGFTSSTTWTAPYDGTFSIFVCGGGGGGGCGGGTVGCYGGGAGGNTSVYTISGSSVSITASGGAGGGGGAGTGVLNYQGVAGAASSWYAGGAGGDQKYAAGKAGGGGTGSSPYGMGGGAGAAVGNGGNGGSGGNGGTSSVSVWLAQGTILQIVVGGGGSGGNGNPYGYQSGNAGGSGSVGVAYITG